MNRELNGIERDIILTGFMGSGKTTIGKEMARELERTFLDTDDLIEELTGKTIPQIFADEGEESFRQKETEAIKGLSRYSPGELVLSTGGGIVLREENVKMLRKRGIIVLLTASVEEILHRVKGSDRPLLQKDNLRERIQELLSSREPIYREVSDFVVPTDGKTPWQVMEEIYAGVKEINPSE